MKEHPIPDFYVTKSEFGEFRGEVREALGSIANKLDAKTTTNWGVLWSATGVVAVVVLTIAGGAWALMKANNTSLEKSVQSYEMRLQRIENVQDRDIYAKAKAFDTIVFQQVTGVPAITPAPPAASQTPQAAPQHTKP